LDLEVYVRERRAEQGRAILYRVAGVPSADGRVLVQQFEGERFWRVPGGRVEPGEATEEALAREMGYRIGTLRVSNMGRTVHERLGFETYCHAAATRMEPRCYWL
jgi:ADP-ribose pyrophosphatase YjhB (NUDIX family)